MKYVATALALLFFTAAAWGQNKQQYKAFRKQAEAFVESGELLKAVSAYENALKNKAGDRHATEQLKQTRQKVQQLQQQYLAAANRLFEQGQREEALSQYSQALRWKPGDAYIQSQMQACRIVPGTTFSRYYGGGSYDEARTVLPVSDGGFIVAGRASAAGSSNTDMSVVRIDRDGNKLWEKAFGEDETEEANDIIETRDGNFIIVGHSDSYSGSPGIKDMWAVKINPDGQQLWAHTYGSDVTIDEARSVVEAHDSGYLLAGNSFVNGSLEVMVVKIDEKGEKQWQKSYGGDASEEGNQVIKTEDGYTIIGNTESKGNGKWDIWLLHLDKNGEQLWDSTFGGGDNETGNALVQTADGGYLLAGSTYSFAQASQDFWLVKTDAAGKQIWAKNHGEMAAEEAFSIIPSADGNFVAVGFKEIWNEKEKAISTDAHDIYMVKFDQEGNKLWDREIGGTGEQRGFDAASLPDGSFLVVGLVQTEKTNSTDMLVIKTNAEGLVAME